MARRMAIPVTPSMSETARCTRTFIWSRLFCIRRSQSPLSATRFALSRTNVRSMHTDSSGRNEPRSKPQLCSRWIHSQSVGSDFLSRPGTCASCRVSTSSTCKPCPSSTSCGAIQYTPVLSIATDSTCRAFSHSPMRISSAVVAPKRATSRPLLSSVGAHTQCCSLPRSIPATPRRMTGKPSSCLLLFSEVSLSSLPGIVTHLSEHARPGWPFLILL